MSRITLRVLDGTDRGRVFADLSTPVTIGREEGNTVQLNDERISRFHLKIQEDMNKLVLTDLDSTNGTKVNGEDVQLRILRYGDLITVGRSMLLYGSREQIAERLARLRGADPEKMSPAEYEEAMETARQASLDYELNWDDESAAASALQLREPPLPPEKLSPVQAAQLSELVDYIHARLRNLIGDVSSDESGEHATLEFAKWQNMLDLQSRLAEYLRKIAEPQEDA